MLVLKRVSHVESLKTVHSYVQIAIKYSLYQGATSYICVSVDRQNEQEMA